MKKGNKGVLLTLAVALFAGQLVACSGGNSDSNASDTNAGTASDTAAETVAPMKEVTLTVLHNWNGSSGPEDEDNNPVAKIIREKTGVTLHFEYTKGNEVEKVNTIFATQALPDIYTGPAWGGEKEAIVKAGKQDQLVDLTGKLDKYPNLATAVAQEHVPASLWDGAVNAFGGKQYLLYQGHPATEKDAKDWMYGFYIRKDIAAQTGIDLKTVKNKDDLYNLLKKIKELNLMQDGKPILPIGGFGGGWAIGIINLLFMPTDGSNGFTVGEDGTFKMNMTTKAYEDSVLYIRKLLSEGLIDPEAFTQTEAIGREKITQGRDAMLICHYPAILLDAGKEFLKAHPGTDFIPVGPLNMGGLGSSDPTPLFVQGDNLTAITKKAKEVDSALRVMDFLASDEGWLLTHYGIEGTHYTMVDGKPVANKEWVDKFNADPTGQVKRNEGIDTVYTSLQGLRRTYSLGNGDIYADLTETKALDDTQKIMRPNGIKILSGYFPYDFLQQTPQYEALSPLLNKTGDVWKQAIYSKSDAEALKIINDYREVLKKAGLDEATAAANEMGKGKDINKILYPN